MITIDVVVRRMSLSEPDRVTATAMAEGEIYVDYARPTAPSAAVAASCAAIMARRIMAPGRYVCVEHDEARGYYRFAMVAAPISFTE